MKYPRGLPSVRVLVFLGFGALVLCGFKVSGFRFLGL